MIKILKNHHQLGFYANLGVKMRFNHDIDHSQIEFLS